MSHPETSELRSLPLFSDLSEADLADWASRLTRETFASGSTIVEQGDSPEAVFIVVSGEADVLIDRPDGVTRTLARLGPGDLVGELGVLTGAPRIATVRALEPLVAIAMTRGVFADLMVSPGAAQRIARVVARRLAETTQAYAQPAIEAAGFPRTPRGWFISLAGDRPGTLLSLGQETTIGRADNNSVVISVPQSSRYHMRVFWNGEHHVVEDLGSTNGTLLNGYRLSAPRPLREGDEVSIAELKWIYRSNDGSAPLPSEDDESTSGVMIDATTAEVTVDGRVIATTGKEFLAFSIFVRKPGAIVTRDELIRHVWSEHTGPVSDYQIEEIVHQLRLKIEVDADNPRRLITIPGIGYRLMSDS